MQDRQKDITEGSLDGRLGPSYHPSHHPANCLSLRLQCVLPADLRDEITSIAVQSGDGGLACVAASLADNSISVLDLRMGRTTSLLQGHTASPLCLIWDQPGEPALIRELVTIVATVKLWTELSNNSHDQTANSGPPN